MQGFDQLFGQGWVFDQFWPGGHFGQVLPRFLARGDFWPGGYQTMLCFSSGAFKTVLFFGMGGLSILVIPFIPITSFLGGSSFFRLPDVFRFSFVSFVRCLGTPYSMDSLDIS